MNSLKEKMNENDPEAIKQGIEELKKVSYSFSERLYQEASQQQNAQQSQEEQSQGQEEGQDKNESSDEDVVDADYEVVDEEEKKD